MCCELAHDDFQIQHTESINKNFRRVTCSRTGRSKVKDYRPRWSRVSTNDDNFMMTKHEGSRWVENHDYFLITLGEGIEGDSQTINFLIT